jgi:hypothetical protein
VSKKNLKTKKDILSITEEFLEQVAKIELPTIYSDSSTSIRELLVSRDASLRSIFPWFATPSITYTVRSYEGFVVVTFSRKSKRQEYKDFSFQHQVRTIGGLVDFQTRIFLRLLEESLLLDSLNVFTEIINECLDEANAPFEVLFTPSVFSDKYVEFISNDLLVLSADTDSLLSLSERVSLANTEKLYQEEFNSLSTCQTTVEVLKTKSPIISYLLSSGRLGLAKLLKPVYSKTTKQLKTYKSSTGYGYYYDGAVFGVVERTEYGVSVILDPINLSTLEKELGFDLLKEVE